VKASLFKTGRNSSFSKISRRMAKVLAIGSGLLAVVFCAFIFYYFPSSNFIKGLSLSFPLLFAITFLLCFSKMSNKTLYNFIFGVYLFVSLSLLYIAKLLMFRTDYVILMMAIFNIILFALPTVKQLLYYFVFTF